VVIVKSQQLKRDGRKMTGKQKKKENGRYGLHNGRGPDFAVWKKKGEVCL